MTTDFSDIANVYAELSGISKALEEVNFSSSILKNISIPNISIPSPIEAYPGIETLLKSYQEALKASIDMSQYQSILNNLSKIISGSDIPTHSPDDISMSDIDTCLDADYVTVDAKPVKYFVPSQKAETFSNERVPLSTGDIIALITLIVTLLFNTASLYLQQKESQQNAKTEQERIELQREQNELLREQNEILKHCGYMFYSMDTSHSSRAEDLEALKNSFPECDSVPSAVDSPSEQK